MTDVIDKYADASLPGAVTRSNPAIIERIMNSAKPLTAFGQPCKVVSNKIETIEAGDLASVFYGILSRLAPSTGGDLSADFLSGTPNADYTQAVLVKRYIAVICAIGTPAINSPVYMRTVADTGKALGDFEATKDAVVVGGVITGTGTGTLSITEDGTAKPGTWSIILQETSATAEFYLFDPDGFHVGTGNVGTELVAGGLTLTITDGGTMTIGDSFAPVVTDNNVELPNVNWSIAGKDSNNVTEVFVK